MVYYNNCEKSIINHDNLQKKKLEEMIKNQPNRLTTDHCLLCSV